MLDALRKSAASWVAKGLFVILIGSFAIWGIGDMVKFGGERPVAEIGSVKVSQAELEADFAREFNRLRARLGGQIDREMAIKFGLPRQVLGQIVQRQLVVNETSDLGVVIDDRQVRDLIFQEPAFQTAGRFDRLMFDRMMSMNGLTEEVYVGMLRRDLARQQLLDAVRVGAKAPAALADALYRARQEKRVADLLLLPKALLPPIPPATDEQLQAAYKAHLDRFTAPETRGFTLVVMRPENVAAEISVSDDQIKEAYDSRQAELQTPEKRHATQLLFKDEVPANAAREKLAQGAAPDAVAKSDGGDLTDLGDVHRGELFPVEVENAVFDLPAAGVTPVVKTALGWHVLKVDGIEAGKTKSLAEARDSLKAELQREAGADALTGLSIKLEDALAGGAKLEDAAAALKLPVTTVAAVDRTGKDPAGKTVEGLPPFANLLPTAFQTEQGKNSPIGDAADGSYFALRVDKVSPSAPKPFEAVKDGVVALRYQEELDKAAKADADAVVERLRKGETVDAVAKSRKIQARRSEPFLRTVDNAGDWLPRNVVSALFGAKPGEVVSGAIDDGVVVARLDRIEAAEPAKDEAGVKAVRDQLDATLPSDLEAQYLEALRKEFGVRVNEQALAAMFQQ